ncbi:MAG: hypothetical protein LC637_13455 [Xanthomonadaceae bacterium]|nr:hypothetical protein [Xanthomonadaceae bacterium]
MLGIEVHGTDGNPVDAGCTYEQMSHAPDAGPEQTAGAPGPHFKVQQQG